jgi:hypothetical protein
MREIYNVYISTDNLSANMSGYFDDIDKANKAIEVFRKETLKYPDHYGKTFDVRIEVISIDNKLN